MASRSIDSSGDSSRRLHRPALGRQVAQPDRTRPAALHDLAEDLPELFGVTGPAVPQQHLHGLGRAGQPALLAEPGQEERHQLVQVLDVVAQRRELHRAVEEPQQPGRRALGGLLAVQRHGDPQLGRPARGPGFAQRAGQRVHLPGVQRVDVPDDQQALALEQLAAALDLPVLARLTRRPGRGTARPGSGAGARRGPGPACPRRARPPASATRTSRTAPRPHGRRAATARRCRPGRAGTWATSARARRTRRGRPRPA